MGAVHFLSVPDVIALTSALDLWATLHDFTYPSRSVCFLGDFRTIHWELEFLYYNTFCILKEETNKFRCTKCIDWHWSGVMWHQGENGHFPNRCLEVLPWLTVYIMCLVKWIYGLYHLVWTKLPLTKWTDGFKRLFQRNCRLRIA